MRGAPRTRQDVRGLVAILVVSLRLLGRKGKQKRKPEHQKRGWVVGYGLASYQSVAGKFECTGLGTSLSDRESVCCYTLY